MAEYIVRYRIPNKKGLMKEKIFSPCIDSAEKDAKIQFKGCKIESVLREDSFGVAGARGMGTMDSI